MGQTCEGCTNEADRKQEDILVVKHQYTEHQFNGPSNTSPQFASHAGSLNNGYNGQAYPQGQPNGYNGQAYPQGQPNGYPPNQPQGQPQISLQVPGTQERVSHDINDVLDTDNHQVYNKLNTESTRHIGSDIKFSLNENKSSARLADGSNFEGSLINGLPEGYGKQTFPNGDEYLGYFIKGKRNGTGKMYKPGVSSYHGDFENNKITGYGVITYDNGEEYRGQFRNGAYHGKGTFTDGQGKITEGLWVDGKFQQTV